MTYCGSTTVVNHNGPVHHCISLPCRAWTCPDCGETRKKGLIAQAHGGRPDTFLTLTLRRTHDVAPAEAAARIARAWRLVRLRALREARRNTDRRPMPAGEEPADGWPRDGHGRVPRQVMLHNGKLPFLAVIEVHKSGWPHLHIMLRSKWIAQPWLSAQMAEIAESPVQDVRRIQGRAKVAGYVAKYAGKCACKLGHSKRYWSSRDYDQRPDTRHKRRASRRDGWHIGEHPIAEWARREHYRGWVVTWLSTRKAASTDAIPLVRAAGPP